MSSNFLPYRDFCSMATTSIFSNIGDLSSDGSRMFTITVTGIYQQSMRLANQTISVSYSRLSQTISNIHRNGGKIVDVSIHPVSGNYVGVVPSEQVVDMPVIVESSEVSSIHSVEEVINDELHKPATTGRSKRQNSSHSSKKKKR